MVGAIIIFFCCGSLIGFGTYYCAKEYRNSQIKKKEVLQNFFIRISETEKELMQEKNDFKNLIKAIYEEFYKISTQYKNLCVLQQKEKNQSDNESRLQLVDQLISELIQKNPSTIKIIDLKEENADNNTPQQQKTFQNLLVTELKQDLIKKKIQLEEVYLLQILLLLIDSFPLEDAISYVCYKPPQSFTSTLKSYLRQILIQKLSLQSEQTITSIFEWLFKTDDSKADETTLVQIYSLPNISLESKKILIKKRIFELNSESSSTLIMSSINQYTQAEQSTGDFMIRIKRLIDIHAKKG